jgi:DUF438 domain-containing protein
MEQMERWDDYLIAEHELIERCMAVLKNCLDQLEESIRRTRQLERALDFLLEFGDKMHNKKEETMLFPLLEKRGLPAQGGPIGVMLMEHEAERTLIRTMLNQTPTLVRASASERRIFKEKGLEYLKVRAEHIWKENDILYPMGRKVLHEEDNEILLENFAGLDVQTYGPQARKHYDLMVVEVEQGYGTKQLLIGRLTYEQLHGIMEAMPFEVTFVDAEDTVAYFNRLDKHKLFPRTRSVIGRKVQKCHPEKSVDTVQAIVDGFKNKTMDKAEFWIDFRGDKVLIRYFPVYDDAGGYQGVLEVTQAISDIQKLTGEKRLLD